MRGNGPLASMYLHAGTAPRDRDRRWPGEDRGGAAAVVAEVDGEHVAPGPAHNRLMYSQSHDLTHSVQQAERSGRAHSACEKITFASGFHF